MPLEARPPRAEYFLKELTLQEAKEKLKNGPIVVCEFSKNLLVYNFNLLN